MGITRDVGGNRELKVRNAGNSDPPIFIAKCYEIL